jgi:hypothetical protein
MPKYRLQGFAQFPNLVPKYFDNLPASVAEAALLKVVCRGLEVAEEFCKVVGWLPLPGDRRL